MRPQADEMVSQHQIFTFRHAAPPPPPPHANVPPSLPRLLCSLSALGAVVSATDAEIARLSAARTALAGFAAHAEARARAGAGEVELRDLAVRAEGLVAGGWGLPPPAAQQAPVPMPVRVQFHAVAPAADQNSGQDTEVQAAQQNAEAGGADLAHNPSDAPAAASSEVSLASTFPHEAPATPSTSSDVAPDLPTLHTPRRHRAKPRTPVHPTPSPSPPPAKHPRPSSSKLRPLREHHSGCATCGTRRTPEWRQIGGRVYCNACGLRVGRKMRAEAGKKDERGARGREMRAVRMGSIPPLPAPERRKPEGRLLELSNVAEWVAEHRV